MEHGLKGLDTDFFPRRNNSNTDWTDDADLRGISRFRVDTDFPLVGIIATRIRRMTRIYADFPALELTCIYSTMNIFDPCQL